MIWEKIKNLLLDKKNYDDQSQSILDDFPKTAEALESLDVMKKTVGWQTLEKILREKLQSLIIAKIKDDVEIRCVMDLLKLSDTKTQWQQLEDEVDKLLPPE